MTNDTKKVFAIEGKIISMEDLEVSLTLIYLGF